MIEVCQPLQSSGAGLLDGDAHLSLRSLTADRPLCRQRGEHGLPLVFHPEAVACGQTGHLPDGFAQLIQLDEIDQHAPARGNPRRAEVERHRDHQRIRPGGEHRKEHAAGLGKACGHLVRRHAVQDLLKEDPFRIRAPAAEHPDLVLIPKIVLLNPRRKAGIPRKGIHQLHLVDLLTGEIGGLKRQLRLDVQQHILHGGELALDVVRGLVQMRLIDFRLRLHKLIRRYAHQREAQRHAHSQHDRKVGENVFCEHPAAYRHLDSPFMRQEGQKMDKAFSPFPG